MRFLLTLFLFTVSFCAFAATETINLQIVPQYKGAQVVFEDVYYPLPGGDSVAFDVLKCYISDIAFYKGGELVHKEARSYHLVNAAKEETMRISMQVPQGMQYDNIRFHIGIDSVTNTLGALDGDLDPAKGMYWAWQSGYINFKLEGRSNRCATRNHEFSFHLGGYLPPNYAMQRVALPVNGKQNIPVAIQLDAFLQSIDLRTQNEVMIPSAQAVNLSQKLAKAFVITGQ